MSADKPIDVGQLLPNLHENDPDLRYMALNDIIQNLSIPESQFTDSNLCDKVVRGLLLSLKDRKIKKIKMLTEAEKIVESKKGPNAKENRQEEEKVHRCESNEPNGDVQEKAINCLEPVVKAMQCSLRNHFGEGLLPLINGIARMDMNELDENPGNKAWDLANKAFVANLPPYRTPADKDAADHSIPALALHKIVISLKAPKPGEPRDAKVQNSYQAIKGYLIPHLIGRHVLSYQPTEPFASDLQNMLQKDIDAGTDSNAIDVLTAIARCFGAMLDDKEIEALLEVSFGILNAPESSKCSSGLKKKAVVAVSALATYFSDSHLSTFLSSLIERLGDPNHSHSMQRLYITILGSLARSTPKKFGPYLKTLAPFVLSALSAEALDEGMKYDSDSIDDSSEGSDMDGAREAALVALEAFLGYCPQEMRIFTDDVIAAAVRFLRYDPTLAYDDDDDDLDEDDVAENDSEDDDFEEDGVFGDEDDTSWKIRRCAGKVLHTLILTRSVDLLADGTLYEKVAPALVARFKEREESVRLEVISTLSTLIRNSRDESTIPVFNFQADGSHTIMGPPASRKRRRGGSDASMVDSHSLKSLSAGFDSPAPGSPPTGPRGSLAKLSPGIIGGVAQLLKMKQLPTRQSAVLLLRDVVLTQRGGLGEYLNQVMDPVIDTIKSSSAHATTSSSSSAITANSLRIEALALLGAISDFHSSKVLQPFFPKAIPAIVQAAQDKYSKVAVEALNATEKTLKAITPPRAVFQGQQNYMYLESIFDVLLRQISTKDVDTEVRRRAVHVLGLLLGRTSGAPDLLSPGKRASGLDELLIRLKNELTRLATVRTIEVIALHTQNIEDLSSPWVRIVTLELGAQLRKSSRSLRGASLGALKAISTSPYCRGHLDINTVKETIDLLLPILGGQDLHMLGPTLMILAALIKDNGKRFVTKELTNSLCAVVTNTVTGASLDALLAVARAIGEQGAGKDLMRQFLAVGISGNPDILGRAIGMLLVYGGQTDLGVKLDQFYQELNYPDDRRQRLAVTVMGEVGLQMGTQSPLTPNQFMACFSTKSEQLPLAAAVAMGRAGSSNIKIFLPSILSSMGQQSSSQYLLMHSIKEILQHKDAEAEVSPFAPTLWQNLVAASQVEDNRAIGAECIGRLAIIDPKTYLHQLQTMLNDRKPIVRGMAVAALRYTLADTDEAYDEYLGPIVIGMLTKMMNESDLENRRLGLTAFNSAMQNKPELILPHLEELLPLAMHETIIKPELIREVQMGPFKHKVDDGLEIRKSAYETLYALLESAFNRLSISDIFERIIAGIDDEYDIRILCNLMLVKLSAKAPDETSARLHLIADRFMSVLSIKAKDNAVKQELEKMHESAKGIIKVSLQLNNALIGEDGSKDVQFPEWTKYWTWVKNEHTGLVKFAEDEVKERDK